jgi:uncharacterized protein
MTIATVCIALLGLLVFGLGLNVSRLRRGMRIGIGYPPDPTHPLHKACRAHANACEYAPMMGVLILLIGSRDPAAGILWVFVAATAARFLHAMGMLASPTLAAGHPLRVAGAAGTYVTGLVLVVAALVFI